MNGTLRIRKDMQITALVPFKYILYMSLLSSVVPYEDDDGIKYAVFSERQEDVYDYFSDWSSLDDDKNEVLKALNDLGEEGLLLFDEDGRIYVGEFRGKKLFTFEVKNSIFDDACKLMFDEIKRYGRSKSVKDRSRASYIREQIQKFIDKGVDKMTPGDFTELHNYLYEVYTGGELYIVRGKVEMFQTNNMLKAYDKFTVFSLIVQATLRYDSFRRKGLPTLTTVACMKDDVFHDLTKEKSGAGSKEYMRDIDSDDSDF